jgi:predicted DNA binding protein
MPVMSIVVEVTVPADRFALPEALSSVEDGMFRAVRLVAHGSDNTMPFLWIDCGDVARLREAVDEDPSVRDVDVLASFDERCLLAVEWDPRVRVFLSVLRAEGAFVLAVSGYGGAWHFRIYFSDHDRVAAARESCEARGVEATFGVENRLSEGAGPGYFGLTERQYETLVRAYELGYYNVPRAVTQEELADRLGVTHQALSERLRRAHETLVANGLPQAAHRRDDPVPPRAPDGVDI